MPLRDDLKPIQPFGSAHRQRFPIIVDLKSRDVEAGLIIKRMIVFLPKEG